MKNNLILLFLVFLTSSTIAHSQCNKKKYPIENLVIENNHHSLYIPVKQVGEHLSRLSIAGNKLWAFAYRIEGTLVTESHYLGAATKQDNLWKIKSQSSFELSKISSLNNSERFAILLVQSNKDVKINSYSDLDKIYPDDKIRRQKSLSLFPVQAELTRLNDMQPPSCSCKGFFRSSTCCKSGSCSYTRLRDCKNTDDKNSPCEENGDCREPTDCSCRLDIT